jgi:hypothetical protein
VQKRVEEVTEVSERTIRRILGEHKNHERNFIQYARQDIQNAETCDRQRFSTSVSCGAQFMNFVCKKKTSATISKLLPKLRYRIDFKGGSTSLRNVVKELGFLWKKTRNSRVVLIEKHDVR